jgi:hypothetical protein
MANEQNLIKNEDLTPEQRRKNASKAGKASGEARRNKKLLRECLEILLEKEMKGKNGETMSGAEALTTKLFAEAMKGNVKAFEVIRDTAGQKPVEKIMVADVEPAVIAEVEAIVNGKAESS